MEIAAKIAPYTLNEEEEKRNSPGVQGIATGFKSQAKTRR